MDSSHYLSLLLVGEPLLRRTLSLQIHEPLRQRIAVHYHLEGLSREELDAYLAHQLKAAGVSQPLFDDTARQALYQATKGILPKSEQTGCGGVAPSGSQQGLYHRRSDSAGCSHRGALVSGAVTKSNPTATVLPLGQLLEQQPTTTPACLVEPGLLPLQGILFIGGEPKVGKSLLVANLALSLAAGADRLGFPVRSPRRVLVCQFELPLAQFVSRLAIMRSALGPALTRAVDLHPLVDTRATGHLLSAAQGLSHFIAASQDRFGRGDCPRSSLLHPRSG